jgi:hypothetical protein
MSNWRPAVYERDGWQCKMPSCLCPEGRAIDPQLRGTDSLWAPSIDHIVRRSQDGPGSRDNVRAAHRWCNMADAGVQAARPKRRKPYQPQRLSYRIGDLYAEQAGFLGDQGSAWS